MPYRYDIVWTSFVNTYLQAYPRNKYGLSYTVLDEAADYADRLLDQFKKRVSAGAFDESIQPQQ